jgi:hypothetical protein
VSNNGKLYTLFDDGSHITSSTRFFHCIDGGPGSFSTNGYNRGAKDFADDVKAAALKQHWHVSLETITRPILGGQDVGEDGVTFDGTVYVLTVTK